MKKGQVSIEYLLVLGFLLLLLVPLLILYNDTQKSTQDALVEAQVRKVGNLVRDAAERVYFAGEPAQETLQLYFPRNIKSLTFTNASLYFTVAGGAGEYDVLIPSLAPMEGTLLLNEGVHIVTIRAEDGLVQVSE